MRMLVLFEDDRIILLADTHMRSEGVRLGNLFDRFQIAALIFHHEKLPCAIRAHGFDATLLAPAERGRFQRGAGNAAARHPRTLRARRSRRGS